MTRACFLVNVAPDDTLLLSAAIRGALPDAQTSVARFDIAVLNALSPDLLIIDPDDLAVDPLEALRQLRFVAPESTIVVYTGSPESSFARECHNAGATCLLSKSSSEDELTSGIRQGLRSGCFTDPRFGHTV